MLRRPTSIGLAVLLSLVVLLSACGQKGPLYLPDENTGQNDQNDDRNNQDQNNNN